MNVLRNMRQKMKEKKGFTLIEMIIVIAIIAILIALIAPNLTKFLKTANDTKAKGAAKTLYTSANAYLAELTISNTALPTSTDPRSGWGDFMTTYFNAKETANIDSCSVEFGTAGVVTSAKWKFKGGVEMTYPETATPTATP